MKTVRSLTDPPIILCSEIDELKELLGYDA